MIIYSIITYVNHVNNVYEVITKGGKFANYCKIYFYPTKCVYYIEDEIWEIIDKEEIQIFNDFIYV